jgi:hypothetical protein
MYWTTLMLLDLWIMDGWNNETSVSAIRMYMHYLQNFSARSI